MSDNRKFIELAFERLSKELGISKKFVVDLYAEENSWSFTSKLAQLVEGTFTHAIVEALGEPKARRVVSNMTQASRIELLRDLGYVDTKQKTLFLAVAEIRNQYIHNVSNVDRTLADYIRAQEPRDAKALYNKFRPFFVGQDKAMSLDVFIADCKVQMFYACSLQLLKVHGDVSGDKARKDHEARRLAEAGRLLPARKKGEMFPLDRLTVSSYVTQARDILKREGLFVPEFK